MKKPKLTKDELATAWFACGHAMAFWKRQGQRKRPIVEYCKTEYQKYADLSAKLDAMLDKP